MSSIKCVLIYICKQRFSLLLLCVFLEKIREEEKTSSRERAKEGTKTNKKAASKNNAQRYYYTRQQQKKGHTTDAGEVESNNWAVKPPQV